MNFIFLEIGGTTSQITCTAPFQDWLDQWAVLMPQGREAIWGKTGKFTNPGSSKKWSVDSKGTLRRRPGHSATSAATTAQLPLAQRFAEKWLNPWGFRSPNWPLGLQQGTHRVSPLSPGHLQCIHTLINSHHKHCMRLQRLWRLDLQCWLHYHQQIRK